LIRTIITSRYQFDRLYNQPLISQRKLPDSWLVYTVADTTQFQLKMKKRESGKPGNLKKNANSQPKHNFIH